MQRFILCTLLVTALGAGCGPSAESVIAKHRVSAREKIDLMRALVQAEGFTRAAALEAPRGIRVNVVSPP